MLHHTFLDLSECDIFRDCVKDIAKASGGGKFTSKIGKARPKLEKMQVKRVEHILTVPFMKSMTLEVLRWELLLDWNLSTASAHQPSSQLPKWNRWV